MPRLALNAVSVDTGGALRVLAGYLASWREIEADLEIVVYASRRHVVDTVRRVRPDAEIVEFGLGLPLLRRVALQQWRLGRLVDEAGCDVALSTNMLLERCRTPQVVHHQNLVLFQPWREAARGGAKILASSWLARRAMARSEGNVFISEHMRQQASRIVPRTRGRSRVIYNGLDRAALGGAGLASEWSGEPRILAVTGELPHKDNPTLIRALAELVARRPDVPWRLDVAFTGRLDPERELARSLGVADRIRWLGLVDESRLGLLYRKAMCLMFTSRVEGFGIPIIEAMARGCPVVACDCSAMPEIAGDAALLVEPSNALAFAEAATRLLTSGETRDRLTGLGVERAKSFRWEKSARRMLALIEEVA
jgi:glycosyltransferase involved in cell wall biosynthesis